MRRLIIAAALMLLGRGVAAQAATSSVEEIHRGVNDGLAAGRRSNIRVPFAVAWSTAGALALRDDRPLNNNNIVVALTLHTAITAGATWAGSLLFPPRPTREQNQALATQPPLYSDSWRRGFREASGARRFAANAVAVITSVGISYLVYTQRD